LSLDVALIHPPSVYDFRESPSYASMISEVIPSMYVFDMMPYGFLTLATYLERNGLNVAIFNVAAKMLKDRSFDFEKYIRRIEADLFGIDLHWAVHAQGAMEIARIIKEIHPESKVVLGGLSSTYFRYEVIRYPFIDAILTGDSAELPLLRYIEEGPEKTPNVIWKDGGRIRENPLSWIPESLDGFEIDHEFLLRNVKKTRDLAISSPFASFDEAPIAGVITMKGCPFNCITCGGSRFAYERAFMRRKLAIKSPEAIADEVEGIARISKMPIFFVGDLRIGGIGRVERVSKLLKKLDLENELIFEFFTPPSKEVLGYIRGTSHSVYLQISPESPFEDIRRAFGRPYTNQSLEKMISNSESLGFERLDLYFMVGLPLQRREHATSVADYFRKLREISKRLDSFVSPLAPFVDPGSIAYTDPEAFGYRITLRDFEDYRRALLSRHWVNSLNYETRWMNKKEIAEASLDAYERLLTERYLQGIVEEEAYELARERIELDRLVLDRVERGISIDDLKDRIDELARRSDARVKKGLSLYPTSKLAERIRNPILRALITLVR